jgi:hypothetical protein
MNDNFAKPDSYYPVAPACTLREACQNTGHDDGGKHCPVCPLKDLCESEERWLVELASRSRCI